MTRTVLRMIGVALVLALGCPPAMAAAAPEVALAREGEARLPVVVGEDASQQVREAAAELAEYLEAISGAAFTVEPGDGTRGIAVGGAADFPALEAEAWFEDDAHPAASEAYRLRSHEAGVHVIGASDLGAQHAAYGLLAELGCRWYFPDPVWWVVPEQRELSIGLDVTRRPAFAWRRIWYGHGTHPGKIREDYHNWQRKNGQFGSLRVHTSHSYHRHLPRSLFDEHPELFALVEGERQPTQPCFSNPEVRRRVIENVLAAFADDPERDMVSVDPNDNVDHCECEDCLAMGSVSDRAFGMANEVARVVREEHPGKRIGILAYSAHSEPPSMELEPNVHVHVTTAFRRTDLSFAEQVRAFQALGASVGTSNHISVYAWDMDIPGDALAGRVYTLADRIKEFAELGLTTYSAESGCNWGPNGLGYWMVSQLLWNPSRDPHALADDFYHGAFGDAAEPASRIYERWATGERFTPRGLTLALRDLDEAYDATDEPAVLDRLDRLAMYLHFLRLHEDYRQAVRDDASEEAIINAAREVVIHARRIGETGMIHLRGMFNQRRLAQRFRALLALDGFERERLDAWAETAYDPPGREEVAAMRADDLERFAHRDPVDIADRTYTGDLVRLTAHRSEAVAAWGEAPRASLGLESGELFFTGEAGEHLELTLEPLHNHTVEGTWTLRAVETDETVATGELDAGERNVAQSFEVTLPEAGVYALEPGTGYWSASEVRGLGERPRSVWAGRGRAPDEPRRPGFRPWRPQPDEPFYFYVPEGMETFVIGIAGGRPRAEPSVELRTDDGTVVFTTDGDMRGEDVSVRVPEGADGRVWRIGVSSLRCVVELYDLPPYVAAHPAELLVPAEAVGE